MTREMLVSIKEELAKQGKHLALTQITLKNIKKR